MKDHKPDVVKDEHANGMTNVSDPLQNHVKVSDDIAVEDEPFLQGINWQTIMAFLVR